jgi:hypothetical protein
MAKKKIPKNTRVGAEILANPNQMMKSVSRL